MTSTRTELGPVRATSPVCLRPPTGLVALLAALTLPMGCVEAPSSGETSAAVQSPDVLGWNAGWDALGGTAVGDPSITVRAPSRSDVFVQGSDGRIYHRWSSDGSTWLPAGAGNWQSVGNTGKALAAPVAVVHGSSIDLFAREVPSGHLVTRTLSSADSWSDWHDLGGVFVGRPAVAASRVLIAGSGPFGGSSYTQLDVVVRAPDNTIWCDSGLGGDASAWQGFRQIGGLTNSDPTLFASGTHVELAVRGVDNALYRQWRDDGKTWQPSFQPLGGTLGAAPAIAGSSAADVTLAASFTDSSIRELTITNGVAGGWSILPGGQVWSDGTHAEVARPVALSTGVGSVMIFVQGADRALYALPHGAGAWGAARVLATCFTTDGAPAVAGDGAQSMDVAIVAHDLTTWHDHFGASPTAAGATPPACALGKNGEECYFGGRCTEGKCAKASETIAGVTSDAMICACGGNGEACCANQGCDGALVCDPHAANGPTCELCGTSHHVTCAGSTCAGPSLTPLPENGELLCEQCGSTAGMPCCGGSTCGAGLTCDHASSTAFGAVGQCVAQGSSGTGSTSSGGTGGKTCGGNAANGTTQIFTIGLQDPGTLCGEYEDSKWANSLGEAEQCVAKDYPGWTQIYPASSFEYDTINLRSPLTGACETYYAPGFSPAARAQCGQSQCVNCEPC
jgi:hypothetical protein